MTLARLTALAALFVATLSASPAAAQRGNRTGFLVERLKYPPKSGVSDDFRVRTNAALALGQTNDDDAVAPLCTALESDPSESVRQAVAAALGRLGRSTAVSCLRARTDGEGKESSTQVRLQIARAVAALEASSGETRAERAVVDGPFKPALNEKAKYYISIAPVATSGDRSRDEIQRMVLEIFRSKLESAGQFQLAPDEESLKLAKDVLAKRKLRGYQLALGVDFDYGGTGLRVKIKCAVFSYPNRDLTAHFTPGAAQDGVSKGDRGAENNLLKIVSGAAVDQFVQSIEQFAQASR